MMDPNPESRPTVDEVLQSQTLQTVSGAHKRTHTFRECSVSAHTRTQTQARDKQWAQRWLVRSHLQHA